LNELNLTVFSEKENADVKIKTDGKNKWEEEDNIKRNTEVRQGRDASYEEYVMCYVDDIIIYSKTFDGHLVHLGSVINKLTETGFTINLKKMQILHARDKVFGAHRK
jgi:hypothetical protein